MSRKRVLTLDKDDGSIDSTKYRGMIDFKKILRIMLNSEESVNEGEMRDSSKKLKRKFETMKGYEGNERNTIHMVNALKEARMKSREMLLSIHHNPKMLLDIISKMNRKLEDEKIKMNDKGKGKVNDF
ncbi:hypothetical protein Tco_1006561 [Tanacetum coccineum]|uniref:Uncharacterized protein n=1 Tax=Tanacetum coccineum TaxID=301880 RepID=A0ABQ5FIA0_9ASTR